MTYDINEIMGWFEGCNIPSKFSSDLDNEVGNFFLETFGFIYCSGASKLVIIPDNKDFVIKIPFEYEEECDEYPYSGAYNVGPEGETLEFGWDYCALEAALWEQADKLGIGHLFAKTIFIGEYNNYPIYIQEKCQTFKEVKNIENYSEKSKKRSLKLCKENNFWCFNSGWLSDVLDYYDTDAEFMAINKFVRDYHIDDLHWGNMGYKLDGSPVLIDYSDFSS